MMTKAAIMELQTHLRDRIKYGCYVVNGTNYFVDIEQKMAVSNGDVVATFVIDHKAAGNFAVKRVQLCDKDHEILAYKDVNITRQDSQEGILYRFCITLTQA